MNNTYDNEMKIEFLSKSNNEAFARIAVAAFVAQLDPTLEEIADILELSLGTVKSRISRARNQLKTEILKIREQNEKSFRHKEGKEGRP